MEFNKSLELSPSPASGVCLNLFQKKEHALLGISPFNSYYSEQRITDLLLWISDEFTSFDIFIPDKLPVYNFLALGYDKIKAEHKTKRQGAYLRNKVLRALENIGYTDACASKKIITMDSLYKNKVYSNLRYNCISLYQNDDKFFSICNDATEWVLKNYIQGSLQDVNLSIAVNYLLDEMPLFIDSPSILMKDSSIFLYHQIPEFITNFYDSYRNKLISPVQGYVQVA